MCLHLSSPHPTPPSTPSPLYSCPDLEPIVPVVVALEGADTALLDVVGKAEHGVGQVLQAPAEKLGEAWTPGRYGLWNIDPARARWELLPRSSRPQGRGVGHWNCVDSPGSGAALGIKRMKSFGDNLFSLPKYVH